MGWLHQDPSGNFHVGFRYGGKNFKRSLKTKNRREAESRRFRLDESIRLIECGRLAVPPEADLVTFLLSDGKLETKPIVAESMTLAELFHTWLDHLPRGTMEDSSLATIRIHMRHLERLLGKTFEIDKLQLGDLQRYVERRSKEQGIRGRPVSGVTIRKDLITFGTVWNWAFKMKIVKRPFPSSGLRYPKTVEKPPFQTWAEITRQIERGGLSPTDQADLWDCLYLSVAEINDLLAFVKSAAAKPFLFPMVAVAAFTGARRSELMRLRVEDIDWAGESVLIREKKRVRGKLTTRRVPIARPLQAIIREYLTVHSGGQVLFPRGADDPSPLQCDEAHDILKRTLAGSKFRVLRGWHVLRHSFASNCATRGIDQRLIDSWLGHQNDETVRRYRHLFPSAQKVALESVFG